MGTKAVFQVWADSKKQKFHRVVVGMTSDGFPENLRIIADNFAFFAKKLHKVRATRQYDAAAIDAVLDAIVKADPSLFLDDIKNPCWLSYRAEFDPKSGQLNVYDAYTDEAV